jgi:protein-disulfide isomerase
MELGGSEAFWKFHDKAFSNQKGLDADQFEAWAVEAGVDGKKFTEAFKAGKGAAKVDEDQALAKKIGATGTPAFRINGKTLSGAQPFEKFKAEIDAQLKAAEELIKKGTNKAAASLELTKANFKEAPEKADQKRRPQEDDKTVWKIQVENDDPVKGGKDALVTIVEWSDFQCPFCSRVNPTISKILEEYKDDVRFVWKDNALPFHKRAKPAATLARARWRWIARAGR